MGSRVYLPPGHGLHACHLQIQCKSRMETGTIVQSSLHTLNGTDLAAWRSCEGLHGCVHVLEASSSPLVLQFLFCQGRAEAASVQPFRAMVLWAMDALLVPTAMGPQAGTLPTFRFQSTMLSRMQPALFPWWLISWSCTGLLESQCRARAKMSAPVAWPSHR